MSKTSMNLQDSFLNQVRRENSEVKVLLVNGTMLRGTVKGFDNFTLILSSRNGQHLVYKHAIAQLLSHRSAPMRHEEGEATAAPAGDEPKAETDEATEEPASPARQREGGRGNQQQSQKPNRDKQQQARPRKEGFNTLDLSLVKLTQEQKASETK